MHGYARTGDADSIPFPLRFLAKNAQDAKKRLRCPKLLGELGALGERNSSPRPIREPYLRSFAVIRGSRQNLRG